MSDIINRALAIVNDDLTPPIGAQPVKPALARGGYAEGGDPVEDALGVARGLPESPLPDLTPAPVMRKDSTPTFAGRVMKPMPVEEAPEDEGITAYHGSPHKFDEFDLSKIGTGEGAQAYGHGLYFAENEDVARDYRDGLAPGTELAADGRRFSDMEPHERDVYNYMYRTGKKPSDAAAYFDKRGDEEGKMLEELGMDLDGPHSYTNHVKFANSLKDNPKFGNAQKGHMYEVRLNAGPEHLLDWDKPLSEQHPDVKEALKKAYAARGMKDVESFLSSTDNPGQDAYESLGRTWGGSKVGSPAAAKLLKESGIRGIRYRDAGSRGADEQSASHNIVVFDPKHINVKRRYAEGGAAPDSDDEGIVAYAFGNSIPHIEQRIAGGEFPDVNDQTQPRPVEHDLLRPIGQSKMIGDEDLLFDEGVHQAGVASNAMNNKKSIRYLHNDENGNPIGALQIMTHGPRSKKATIQNVYVAEDARRQKIASGLLKRARQDFDVSHSTDLTTQGRAFAKAAKAYGGAISPVELQYNDLEDEARRLILWSYAAAPVVRPLSRAEGGPVDDPVDKALNIVGPRSSPSSAVETARNLTPMGFYSAAAEAASKIPQRAPIDQILNKVKGSPGVKGEELDWSGVRDAFTGQRSVDPQEVARHFQENLPPLQETVKYDPTDIYSKLHAKRQSLIFNGQRDEAEAMKDEIAQAYNPSWRRENAAKYGEYTLPDGENYREVLLHLPSKQKREYQFEWFDPSNQTSMTFPTEELARQSAPEGAIINKKETAEHNPDYRSSHWNVPNVVAHLRMSDRDWGKTLHIEEMQSDWGQEGRDDGFVGSTNPNDIAALRGQHEKLNSLLNGPIEDINRSGYSVSKLMEERKQLGQKIASLEEKIKSERTPIGPHVTSNEGWTDLALKRALLEAVKGGYKKLIWTPGNEQAERYDLSNQVKHIMWSPDNKILSALTHDGSEAVGEKVEKEDLHKYIGKEAARKLLDQEPEIAGNMATHHLRGQDISVGGEGMKDFYDRFVPNRLQKLVSKLDPEAKIKLNGHTIVVADKEDEDIDVHKKLHSLEITPKLRAAILKGLPAYEHGGSVDRSRLHFKDVTKRIPQLTEAASSGIGGKEYQDLVNIHKPVKTWGSVPPPASYDEMYNALEPRKREKLGRDVNIPENHPVGLRLDIPAYRDHGVWIPTIHDRSSSANTVLAHAPHARISDVTFNIPQKKAEAVAKGGPKSPFATIDGRWKPTSISDAQDMAEAYLNHPDWRQVGMDPERHSYFYDRETQDPVTHAEEVLQVGPLVLAKNPTYGDRDDYSYEHGGSVVDRAFEVLSRLPR